MTSEFLMPTYDQPDVYFERGHGSFLFDNSGKKYLDFSCGISVTNFGHQHPHLTACLEKQSRLLWHTSNLFANPIVEVLAEKISRASFPGKVFFCNSGAEANEAAIKLARIYGNIRHNGKKTRIITMKEGFHGRTFATLSATAQDKIQAGFEPVLDCFHYITFGSIKELEVEMKKGDVAAVMLELIQGESGVLPAKSDFVKKVRELTSGYKALMIIDEVQTGFGRTGKTFAFSHYGIVPDIMTMAKAMANGLPMGAAIACGEIAELFSAGTHGSTFGGNLLAASVACGVMDLLTEELLKSVEEKGEYIRDTLKQRLAGNFKDIRGKGLMTGIVLPENINNGDIVKECLAGGLVIIKGGRNSIRFYPPLNVSYDEITEGIEILVTSIKKIKTSN